MDGEVKYSYLLSQHSPLKYLLHLISFYPSSTFQKPMLPSVSSANTYLPSSPPSAVKT